jgi:hypothetical protein
MEVQLQSDADLTSDLAEERAAMMEFDGGMSRVEAEARVRELYGDWFSKRSK